MASFCTNCGAALTEGARFCPSCGAAVEAAPSAPASAEPAQEPQPEPLSDLGPAPEREYESFAEPVPTGMSGRTKSLLLGAGIAGALVVAFIAFGLNRPTTDNELTSPAATTSALASEDPNAPRPQEWFDNYKDKFLSAELERLALGAAQKRSFPTAKGSQALGTVPRGTMLKGRWVEGGDPKTRWLKLSDGSYVWEGNLSDPTQITQLGMNGFLSGSSFASIRPRLDTEDHDDSAATAADPDACDVYASSDGLVSVMVIGGKATRVETESERLETPAGMHVGLSERDLLRIYGAGKLKREANIYDGTDYYLWVSKDRGILFHVDSGKVTWIIAGDETIRYAEGCA